MEPRADVRAALGEAIVVLRRREGLKGYELAKKAGMHKSQLSGYELAQAWVSLPVLLRITDALGLTLAEFFQFAEEQAKSRRAGEDSPEDYPEGSPDSRRHLELVAQPESGVEYTEGSEEGPETEG